MELGEALMEVGTDLLSMLPSLVLQTVLRLLRDNFDDVRNLSLCCRCLRRKVKQELPSLYHRHLVVSNYEKPSRAFNLDRPVLALKLLWSGRLFTGGDGEDEKSSSLAIHSQALQLLGKINLSCLKSIQISNCNLKEKGETNKGLLRVLTLNPSLDCTKLDHLSVDICLINLSEIREAIINAVYQHEEDFTNGANIDYIINSAVSQILYTLLTFLDDLDSVSRSRNGHGKSRLKTLHLNFQSREKSDWGELDPETFTALEKDNLKNCLVFMVHEFRERIGLNYGVTDYIKVSGIPSIFRQDTLDLTTAAINEACDLWPCDPHKKPFEISIEDKASNFDLLVKFPKSELGV